MFKLKYNWPCTIEDLNRVTLKLIPLNDPMIIFETNNIENTFVCKLGSRAYRGMDSLISGVTLIKGSFRNKSQIVRILNAFSDSFFTVGSIDCHY